MTKLVEILAQERRIRNQKRELAELRDEVEKLRTQNERTREAMRRCLSCDYRQEAEAHRADPPPPAGEPAGEPRG